ncbi:histidine N-acetyltransferase-like [Argopecten irradians]|uniref:histidine N-acetyltransferase-like n=1 Tax=Argopecten irradians TaxID=31199 RepID=UPI00371F0C4A
MADEEINCWKPAADDIHFGKPTTDEINLMKSKRKELDVKKPMTDDLAGITFRTTTAEDYDDVISVRRHLYDGADYIPYRYYELLEHNTGFAGFIDSTMVCFMFATVIDDGESILLRSIRVRDEYEGKGVYTRLRAFCMKNLSHTANKAVFLISSPTHFEQLCRGSAKLVFSRHTMMFGNTTKSLRGLLGLRDESFLQRVDSSFLGELLRNRTATQYLFPENRVLINWIPYQLVPSNIEWMLRGTEVFSNAVPKQDKIKSEMMISAINVDQCEAGTVVTLDLFGDVCDEEMITGHIYIQLQKALDRFGDILVLYIIFQEHQDTKTVLHVLSKLGWSKVDNYAVYGVEKSI